MTNVIEQTNTAVETEEASAHTDLIKLASWFSKSKSNTSKAIPTKIVYPNLKKAIQDLQEYLGINSDVFLKALYANGDFDDFGYPNIGLVNGIPKIIINNVAHSADGLFKQLKANPKDFTFETSGETEKENLHYFVNIEAENPETSILEFRLNTDPTKELDKVKLKTTPKYWTDSLLEHAFSLDALVDGEYPVESWSKKGKAFLIKIAGITYYSKERHIKNLQASKDKGEATIIVLDGTAIANIDGKEIVYRNVFVKGYEKAEYLKDVVIKLYPEIIPPNKDLLKEACKDGAIILTEPLILNVLGVGDSIYTDKEGAEKKTQFLKCQVEGEDKPRNISFIKAFSKAYETGKFNVTSFEGYQIIVKSVDYYNGYKFNLDWQIPTAIIPTDDTLDALAAELGL
jgi:hypothetical protein